ncbi:hypothetical protein O1L60_13780 [Streptomyces diastatochromogenes]|nr:hypothetical protein [Streptomyces diastatochromogenes]
MPQGRPWCSSWHRRRRRVRPRRVKATVTPSTAPPGADVDVRVQGCKGTTGAAKSKAFVADAELTGRDGGGNPLFGDTTLRSGLLDGTYKIGVVCDGHDHPDAGTVRVRHQQEPTRRRRTNRRASRPTGRRTTPAPWPRCGPAGRDRGFRRAGGPGVAQTTSESGLGTPYTLLGLGMAALAAVAVAFRSARRRAGGDGE